MAAPKKGKGNAFSRAPPGQQVDPKAGTWESSFYPTKKFSVKNYLFASSVSLDFPEYTLLSKNHYDPSWSMKTHRRLKNVIVVMDFAPSKAGLQEVASQGKAFTPKQEANLKRAFSSADENKSGGISVHELKEVLKAVDVDVEGEDGDSFLADLHQQGTVNAQGEITFEGLKNMLQQRKYYRVQDGRYYVALSLFEAECMRAALHQQSGVPLVPGKDTIVALRTGKTMIDASTGYESAQTFQDSTAQVCYRFIDSEVNYMPKDLNLLLRGLQNNSCEKRANFFNEVRSNRRRKQQDPATTSLSKVFVTSDEHHLLQYRIAAGRITACLKARGMYARDAFAAFDMDRDGMLTAQDLKRGLDWLGLPLDQILILDFFREVDKDNDRYINLDDFKAAVGWDDDGAQGGMVTYNGAPIMPPMPIQGDKKQVIKIPEPVLASIKIKVKKVNRFNQVWNSQGSMSRQKISVWEPAIQGGAFKQNRAHVSLGHYIGSGFDNPNRDGKDRLSMEITDTTGNFMGGSSWLPHVLERFMPHPARFRLAWSLTHGSNPFYAWEPIPPSDKFVAMGFVGSKTDTPPDVRSVRCVCKDWVRETTYLHKVWDDSGSGGRVGGIWLINTMNLVGFVAGHDPPRQKPFDLKRQRFFLRDFSDVRAGGDIVPAGGYKPAR